MSESHTDSELRVWGAVGIMAAGDDSVDTFMRSYYAIHVRAGELGVEAGDVAAYIEWNGRLPD